MASTPNLPATPKLYTQNFVQGTDTAGTQKVLATGATGGTKITAVLATSTDGSAAHNVTLALARSGALTTYFNLSCVPVPASSGTNASTNAANMLAAAAPALPLDNDGQPYLHLQSGDTLSATFATALTTSTRIDLIGVGGDY